MSRYEDSQWLELQLRMERAEARVKEWQEARWAELSMPPETRPLCAGCSLLGRVKELEEELIGSNDLERLAEAQARVKELEEKLGGAIKMIEDEAIPLAEAWTARTERAEARVKELEEALELAVHWIHPLADEGVANESGTTIRESLERVLRGEE